MEDLDLKKEKAEPPDSEDDETGSVCPSMRSDSSKEHPPDFSNEPEPPDSEDQSQRLRAQLEELRRLRAKREEFFRRRELKELLRRPRVKVGAPRRSTMFLDQSQRLIAKLEKLLRHHRLRAKRDVSWFLPMTSPMSARKPPDFSTEPEPSTSEDQSQRLIAKLEKLRRRHRLIAKLEKLLRHHRLRAKRDVSWFLPMTSPMSARKPPDFSTEPEPSTSEDQSQRLIAKLEKLRRRHRLIAKLEKLLRHHRLRAKRDVSWFLPMTSPMSARKPPDFSTEPEPSTSEDDETGSVCPSMRSDRSKDIPPDFSNEPEPPDSEWK
ncbi:uncharacterized protein LOC122824449 [Gambusia affinis]|uniref:uncharacterized protein LOC122824449 n=1 Tax=Gambusia affinis TaxID=33528 RepID=UPI001CDC1211|nr:uncharacterized protein LOC122824449 [Gambusia affinis]XP_043961098.1 uncharacterized protein LOC122824449 [Gambusia affinis]